MITFTLPHHPHPYLIILIPFPVTSQFPSELCSIGWITGYLNILGQVAGVASTEWGLSGMILAAVVTCRDDYVIENWHQFLLFTALLIIHGLLKWVGAVNLTHTPRESNRIVIVFTG